MFRKCQFLTPTEDEAYIKVDKITDHDSIDARDHVFVKFAESKDLEEVLSLFDLVKSNLNLFTLSEKQSSFRQIE